MLNNLQDLTFAHLWALILLAIPVLLVIWHIWRYRQYYPEFRLPMLGLDMPRSLRQKLQPALVVFRMLALALLILGLARPQSHLNREDITTEGIDIVMAVDVSGSMLARDFEPNRLEAAKQVAMEFIEGRPNDRIGVVVFAGESFTQCPITTDHAMLKNLIKEIKNGLLEDGTAIGMGLATSVNRLKESEAKSKVVILLTDGVNNSGMVDPRTAADAAIQFGCRVYTIGVGSRGMAPYPFRMGGRTVFQNVEVNIDEKLLREIASNTGGRYFRATDNTRLEEIFGEIDKLEKSLIEVTSIQRVSERFYPFVLLGMIFLLAEGLLRYTWFRSLP